MAGPQPPRPHCPQVLLADGDQLRAPTALGTHEDEQLAEGTAAPAEDAAAHKVHPRPRVSLSPRAAMLPGDQARPPPPSPHGHSVSGPRTSSPRETHTHSHTPCTRSDTPRPHTQMQRRTDTHPAPDCHCVVRKGPTRPTTRTDMSGHGSSGLRLCLLHCAPGLSTSAPLG